MKTSRFRVTFAPLPNARHLLPQEWEGDGITFASVKRQAARDCKRKVCEVIKVKRLTFHDKGMPAHDPSADLTDELPPTPMNYYLTSYTADEAAECLSYQQYLPEEDRNSDKLYRKLWRIHQESVEAGTATPLGGDGHDHVTDTPDGTVETPDGRLDADNTDKAPHWWYKLTRVEQQALNAAAALEYE